MIITQTTYANSISYLATYVYIYIINHISIDHSSFLEILPWSPALLGTLHLSQLHRADGEPGQGVGPLAVQGIGFVEVFHGLR